MRCPSCDLEYMLRYFPPLATQPDGPLLRLPLRAQAHRQAAPPVRRCMLLLWTRRHVLRHADITLNRDCGLAP